MEKPDPERLRNWAELLGTGPLFAASVTLGWYVGSSLDARLGTSPWLMTCLVILGVVGSFWKFIRTLQDMGELSRPKKRRSEGQDRGKTDDGAGGR
jgi:F0F1-type ATP synthase assembly protein I